MEKTPENSSSLTTTSSSPWQASVVFSVDRGSLRPIALSISRWIALGNPAKSSSHRSTMTSATVSSGSTTRLRQVEVPHRPGYNALLPHPAPTRSCGVGERPCREGSSQRMIPSLLPALLRKAVSLTAAGTARRQIRRWLLGEISLQHLWDQAWRRSAAPKEKEGDDSKP